MDLIYDNGPQPTDTSKLGVLLSVGSANPNGDLTVTYKIFPAESGNPPRIELYPQNDFDAVDSVAAMTVAILGKPIP